MFLQMMMVVVRTHKAEVGVEVVVGDGVEVVVGDVEEDKVVEQQVGTKVAEEMCKEGDEEGAV
jgi:hypothetical protein